MLSAVEALALTLALEFAPVRDNAVTPGLMDIPRLHTANGDERDTIVNNRAAKFSGKRVGTAEEVPQVILMLMTHTYLTSEVVQGDGGRRFVSHRLSDPIYD
jgi:NAD(P)-dependent dehydrogenase (short-subunit alcohol dehydrogenase family)